MKNGKFYTKDIFFGFACLIVGLIMAPVILYLLSPIITFVVENYCRASTENFFCEEGLVYIFYSAAILPFTTYLVLKKDSL